jgi:hypothetical protein
LKGAIYAIASVTVLIKLEKMGERGFEFYGSIRK